MAKPLDLPSLILHRDALVLVINKPAGIPVHAGPGGGPNLEAGFDALRFGLPRPPGLAHRLDRDTSGCLVLGRHPKALRKLGKLFQEGRVEKTYWAVVAGGPEGDSGTVDAPLFKRNNRTGGWKMVIDAEQGQVARTDWRVLGRCDGLSWLEFHPRTGRTHQIRVHAASLGCPLLGDPQYGGPDGQPLHLHARAITLPLAASKPPLTVTAPVPDHMIQALSRCGFPGDSKG